MVLPAWVRLVNAAILAAISAVLSVLGQPLWAAIVAAPMALFLAAWLRYHDVPRAERAYNARDRSRAWDLLGRVPFGGRFLRRECRVYYHHVRSLCLLHEERWNEAATEAEAALAVRGISEEAPGCHLAAARAYASLGDRSRATVHADAARKLPHNDAVERGLARLDRAFADAPA